jgi:methionine-S-sulfoxide reductase
MAVFGENEYPVIRNGRIVLRRLSKEDVPQLTSVFDQPIDEQKALQLVSSCDASWQGGTEQILGIVSAYDNHVKGLIELYMHSGTGVMTGYRTVPAWRHLGYGKDAVYTLVCWLADNTEIETVYAAVDRDNEDSLAIVRHCGFEQEEEKGNYMLFAWRKNKEAPAIDPLPAGMKEIYCAGGCFWGTEKAFRLLDGVVSTLAGYANGITDHPRYEDVCRGNTGFKETVRIVYDPSAVSLETVMKAFFLCIDPTVADRQGNDTGSQYQTGVYFTDEEDGKILREIFEEEKKKYDCWQVELEPLRNFFTAEEYHQNYLDKHPGGYCHITKIELDAVKALNRKTNA